MPDQLQHQERHHTLEPRYRSCGALTYHDESYPQTLPPYGAYPSHEDSKSTSSPFNSISFKSSGDYYHRQREHFGLHPSLPPVPVSDDQNNSYRYPPYFVSSGPLSWNRGPYGSCQQHQPMWPPSMIISPLSRPVEYIADIKPVDVLSGRGGATNSHSGNAEFRAIVEQHKVKYLNAKKANKPAVAATIVDLIRKKGGRFLRKYTMHNSHDPMLDANGNVLWYDIGDEKAREKTCQALREGAPEIRRRSDERREDCSEDEDENHHQQARKNSNQDVEVNAKVNLSSSDAIVSSPSAGTHERTNSLSSDSCFIVDGNNHQVIKTTSIESGNAVTHHLHADDLSTDLEMQEIHHFSVHEYESHNDVYIRPYNQLIESERSAMTGHFSIPFTELSKEDSESYRDLFRPPIPHIRRRETGDKSSEKVLWANKYYGA